MNSSKGRLGKNSNKEKAFPLETAQNIPELLCQKKLTQVKFPIVGIGASAGGLEALERFFKAMSDKSGIAFVVIMHLDPTHKSILPELLQRSTVMRVVSAVDNIKVEPNTVYIIPPGTGMSILHGYLSLIEMTKHELTVDTFFRSLAEDQGSNSACIVLSGTGTDGSLGLRSIKGESGLVIVQDQDSSKYNGMPQSAIATGLADVVLPPEKMPEYLLNFVKYTGRMPIKETESKDEKSQSLLKTLLILLRSGTGHDFSLYKKKTIFRRVEKRMLVNKIEEMGDYVRYLQQSRTEVQLLFKELLIGVTNFFRDPEAFETLKDTYFPELFKNYTSDSLVKIWIPGCSTGEEAYSIAIILYEYMNSINCHFNVQIFGTDINEDFIAIARAGVYPESIKTDVTMDRLNNFFEKKDNKYSIRKSIREMIIFAPQDIVKDPPFTKVDMLCCRNLLIYFETELQQKLLPSFHYSLKNEGLLFLGSSESTGNSSDVFNTLDKKWKIYRKLPREKFTHPVVSFQHQELIRPFLKREIQKRECLVKDIKEVSIVKLLKTIISQSDLPPCVAIDGKGDILYIHGSTGRYLEPTEGEICFNILEMARYGLKSGLLKTVNKVKSLREEIKSEGLKVKYNGGYIEITLTVRPLPDFQTDHHGLMLVIFEETLYLKDKVKSKKSRPPETENDSEDLKNIEEELLYTKEVLNSNAMELETYNEELRSANEELQSTNEELQSTNEELETSKEELQSLNEESNTLNSELQNRIDRLTTANDDIKNLLDATEIATIFLNMKLEIRRFTPSSTDIFPLIETDIGRSISNFASSLVDVDMHLYAKKVLKDLGVREIEVENKDEKIFRLRIKPYRTSNNVIDGVVITFENITKLKKLESQLRTLSYGFEEKLLMMSKVFTDSADPIIIEDIDGIIFEVNSETVRSYGWSRDELVGKPTERLLLPKYRGEMKKTIKICKEKGKPIRNIETIRVHKSGKHIPVLITYSPIFDMKGNISAIGTIEKTFPTAKLS
jgi:two-component system, chemotaxis family, CheB/CheR fusion protein